MRTYRGRLGIYGAARDRADSLGVLGHSEGAIIAPIGRR